MIERLSILGFGNLQHGPKVAASIANFFGEREVEIYCWDQDKEKCDIMCRVLRYFLKVGGVRHYVYSFQEVHAAIDATHAIIQLPGTPPISAVNRAPRFSVGQFEPNFNEDEAKFQCLRWINKEEYPSELVYSQRESELLCWLNQL